MAGPAAEPLSGVVVAGASLSVVLAASVRDEVLLAEVVVLAWLVTMVVLDAPDMLDDMEPDMVVWEASEPVLEAECDEVEAGMEVVMEPELPEPLPPPTPPTLPEPLEPEVELALGLSLPLSLLLGDEPEPEPLQRFWITVGTSSRALV